MGVGGGRQRGCQVTLHAGEVVSVRVGGRSFEVASVEATESAAADESPAAAEPATASFSASVQMLPGAGRKLALALLRQLERKRPDGKPLPKARTVAVVDIWDSRRPTYLVRRRPRRQVTKLFSEQKSLKRKLAVLEAGRADRWSRAAPFDWNEWDGYIRLPRSFRGGRHG